MKKFSLWKFLAACVLAAGGVIAACSSSTTDTAGAQFPLDRYEASQPHTEQLLRTAQAEPYARDAGVGSSSATRGDAGTGRGATADAGARGGTGDAGASRRTVEPGSPPGTPPSPGTTIQPEPTPSPTPTPPSPTPSPSPTPTPSPTPPAGAPGGH